MLTGNGKVIMIACDHFILWTSYYYDYLSLHMRKALSAKGKMLHQLINYHILLSLPDIAARVQKHKNLKKAILVSCNLMDDVKQLFVT